MKIKEAAIQAASLVIYLEDSLTEPFSRPYFRRLEIRLLILTSKIV